MNRPPVASTCTISLESFKEKCYTTVTQVNCSLGTFCLTCLCSVDSDVSPVRQLEEELVQMDKSNTQLKLSVSELRLRLRTRDKEMHKEMLKVSTNLTLTLQ